MKADDLKQESAGMRNESIRVAVDWWVNRLRGIAKKDNGDTSESGAFGFVLATLDSANSAPLSEETLEAFRSNLTKEINAALQAKREDWILILHCDYDPDQYLTAAARNSGIDRISSRFPYKTTVYR